MFLQVLAVGNLGSKPELRYTPSGTAVTNLSLAVNRSWKDGNGEKQTEVTWLRVTAWGRRAEVCVEYLDKGRQIMVVGYLNPDENGNPRIWNRNDGSPAASFEMTATDVKFLGSKSDNGGGLSAQDEQFAADQGFGEFSEDSQAAVATEEQDEIPF